jgi:C-terminal processing protease CtpA/Prc
MQQLNVLLLLSFFSFTNNFYVEATNFPENEINSEKNLTQVEKLSATAKIWGFLKYYHPQVAKGKFNWDEQLFTVLEKVEKAETSRELSAIFSTWIDSLGEVAECTNCLSVNQDEVFLKNFDLSWIESKNFSKDLSEKLKYIERNRVQGKQQYVKLAPARNVAVQNEPEYEHFLWEEKELRLLSLFRYWNQVEYFFPYKYQMDRNWDETLSELMPLFLNAKNEKEYHMAMLELASSLNDSHGWFVTDLTNRYFGYYWAPVKLKMIDGKVVVASMFDPTRAEKDDWQLGDILTSVAGVPVSQILEKDEKYMTGSNQPARYRNIEISLLNGSSSSVEIEILRDGDIQKKKISRYLKTEFKSEKPEKPVWEILDDNIGYVNMGTLERGEVSKMMKELKDTRGIIFDIRNYPNGTMYDIGNELNTETQPFVKLTVPDLNYPGRFTWTKPMNIGRKNEKAYKGKVILLVNEDTQSHAEFTAMALQTAPGAIIIGSQTSGADGNISDISFLGKFTTYMSGIGVFYPDGRETQRIGIVPDIEVKPTLEGIKEERDEVLEKAVEVIQKTTEQRSL